MFLFYFGEEGEQYFICYYKMGKHVIGEELLGLSRGTLARINGICETGEHKHMFFSYETNDDTYCENVHDESCCMSETVRSKCYI